MLMITYGKKGVRIGHACFLSEDEIKNREYRKHKCDIVYVYGTQIAPTEGKLLRNQNTIIKDLSFDEDEIFASFPKHLRKHIRRSYKDPNVRVIFFDSEEIQTNKEILRNCKMLFEKMYRSKNMETVFNMQMALAIAKAGYLWVGIAYIDDNPIGFSAFLLKDRYARRWITAFDFRSNFDDSQTYGDAHKRLDWEMMLLCKRNGASSLDLGGVNSFDDPNGIAKYKLEFENVNKVVYQNYVIPTSLLGYIVAKLKKF